MAGRVVSISATDSLRSLSSAGIAATDQREATHGIKGNDCTKFPQGLSSGDLTEFYLLPNSVSLRHEDYERPGRSCYLAPQFGWLP
jgi:hypothetical protein